MWRRSLLGLAFGTALLSAIGSAIADQPTAEALNADIVFLGEQHDNPAHHAVQAAWVLELSPRALVFEMLTPEQGSLVTAENRSNEDALEAALAWEASGWPDFSMYFPIFAAAPQAEIYGAGVPRDRLGALMQEALASVAGAEVTARFGLDAPLPLAEQEAREALQAEAHCDALPTEMLPKMVNVQRVRDAALAAAALDALERSGGPVVVITGNGHAREDWGAPFLVRFANPEPAVFSLGQGEAGRMPTGGFGAVQDAPAVDRGDPCDAFR